MRRCTCILPRLESSKQAFLSKSKNPDIFCRALSRFAGLTLQHQRLWMAARTLSGMREYDRYIIFTACLFGQLDKSDGFIRQVAILI